MQQDVDSLSIDKNTHFPDSIELKPHSAHKGNVILYDAPWDWGKLTIKKYWKVPVVWVGFWYAWLFYYHK